MTRGARIASLDGLRGLAAAAVVVSHVDSVIPSIHTGLSAELGANAVALFFTLSGFLMTVLYAFQPFDRTRVSAFLVSRFARIYPAYLASVLLIILLSNMPGPDFVMPIDGATAIARHVAMIGSSGVFWSIPPEIQFYCVFPVIWLCIAFPQRYRWLSLLLFGAVAGLAIAGFPGPGILLFSKVHFFMAGVLAGIAHHRWPHGACLRHGLGALVLLAGLLSYQTIFPEWNSWSWGLSTAVVSFLIVSGVAREHPVSAAVLANAPLRFLGKISFSLYLFHVPALFLTEFALHDLLPPGVILGLGIVTAIALSSLTNRFIEDAGRIAIISWWKNRSVARPDEVSGSA